MRVEFWVEPKADGWGLRRGPRALSAFDDRDRAVAAADRFARGAAQGGDTGVVKLLQDGVVAELAAYRPDLF